MERKRRIPSQRRARKTALDAIVINLSANNSPDISARGAKVVAHAVARNNAAKSVAGML